MADESVTEPRPRLNGFGTLGVTHSNTDSRLGGQVNESAMIERIKHQRGSIGYLSKAPTDAGLRTLLVLKVAPVG